jgi:lipopolysaccharide cholinephosphotransferase
MPRPDYERMISLLKDDRYQVSCCENNDDYHTPFARIWDNTTILKWNNTNEKNIGVFIDIFPIDGYPSNDFLAKIHMYRLKWFRVKSNTATRESFKDNEDKKIIKKIFKFIYRKPGNYYCKQMNKLAKKYNYETSEYVGVTTTSVHIFRERNKKNIYNETVYLPFENLQLPSIGEYDIYLTKLYGNYMKLPPENKRVSEHDFRIYRK